jgi:hypothetical protein
MNTKSYAARVLALEDQGLSTSDAQAVVLAEDNKRAMRNKARRDRDQVMRDMGMVKVRGALGGTYWE